MIHVQLQTVQGYWCATKRFFFNSFTENQENNTNNFFLKCVHKILLQCIKTILHIQLALHSLLFCYFLYLETSLLTAIVLFFTWVLTSGLCLKANTSALTVRLYEVLTSRELWWNTSLSMLSIRPESSCRWKTNRNISGMSQTENK